MKKVTTTVALAAVSLALPASAVADSLGYNSVPGGVIQTTVAPNRAPLNATQPATSHSTTPIASTPATATPKPAAATGSSLPFTGLDVGLVAAAGMLLVGAGLALRKVKVGPGSIG